MLLFLVLRDQLDFWKGTSYVGNPVDIMVSPTLRDDVVRSLGRRGIRITTMVEDVQKDAEEVEANLKPQAFDYNNYNTIADVGKSSPQVQLFVTINKIMPP